MPSIRFSQRAANLCSLGVWRSLVARSVRVGEVPSSNLGTPMGKPATVRAFLSSDGGGLEDRPFVRGRVDLPGRTVRRRPVHGNTSPPTRTPLLEVGAPPFH